MDTLPLTVKFNDRKIFVISAAFLSIAIICLIINYSVNNTISWSLFPLGGLIVLWATLMPMLFFKKHKALGVFIGLAITLIPFVFLVQNLVSSKGWVVPLALPIITITLLAFGLSLIAFNNKKLNKFYAVALTVFLFGVIVNYAVGLIVNHFLDESNVLDTHRVTTMSLSIVVTMIFIFIAYFKQNQVK